VCVRTTSVWPPRRSVTAVGWTAVTSVPVSTVTPSRASDCAAFADSFGG
jgi:hypothetical protein